MSSDAASKGSSDTGVTDLDLDLDSALLTILENYDTATVPMISPHLTSGGGALTDAKTSTTWQAEGFRAEKMKSWHQRRREEILRLRGEVQELSAILKQSKTNATGRTMATAWEKIAKREFLQSQASADENARLRELVRHHDLQIKALQRAVKRRARTIPLIPSRSCLGSQEIGSLLCNRTILDGLTAGMDDIYAGLDSFFDQARMDELSCPSQRKDSWAYREKGIYVELLDCYAVPFARHETENAIWALTTTPAGEPNALFGEYFAADETTRMKSVCFNVSRHESEMRVVVHFAVRKFVEEDRTVFIGRKLVEPTEDVVGVFFKETTRVVVRHGKPSAIGPTTVIQTHCRVTYHEKPLSRPHARANWQKTPYYESGVQAWEHSISSFNLKVEDTLLRESLKV